MQAIPYPFSAAERAIKAQEVTLRTSDGRLKQDQAAGILGIANYPIRRWKQLYEPVRYDRLFDPWRQSASPKSIPLEV